MLAGETLTSDAGQGPAPSRAGGVRCREMRGADKDAVIGLLREAFPRRDQAYWVSAFERLEAHEPPRGLPRYGFMLEADGAAVGVLLLISAAVPSEGRDLVRSNVSSWYVRPAFRMCASMLVSRALRLPAGSFVNVSPAEPTWKTIEAQGFRRFSSGAVAAVPWLSWRPAGAKAHPFDPAGPDEPGLAPEERRLLRDHAAAGCLSLFCQVNDARYPFVFRRRRVRGLPLPCAHLVYCRDLGDLARFAGPVGRFLAARGMLWTLASADDPERVLSGKHYKARLPMYFAGQVRPRPGDLAYTEAALFGF